MKVCVSRGVRVCVCMCVCACVRVCVVACDRVTCQSAVCVFSFNFWLRAFLSGSITVLQFHCSHPPLSIPASSGRIVLLLHGDMDQSSRVRMLQEFKKGDNKVLVATDVAGMWLVCGW